MLNFQYQLFCLLLVFAFNSIPVSAQPQAQTNSEYFGSASSGWDLSGPGAAPAGSANPNSDTSNQAVYQGENGYPGMPVHQNPVNNAEYTANVPNASQTAPNVYTAGPGSAQNIPGLPDNGNLPVTLPVTSQRNLTPINPKVKLDAGTGLPPTVLDSFVAESHYNNAIYGDEGGITPNFSSSWSVISTGFNGETKKGLTTGHGSKLPSAWSDGWSVSGPNYASNPLDGLINTVAPTNLLTR